MPKPWNKGIQYSHYPLQGWSEMLKYKSIKEMIESEYKNVGNSLRKAAERLGVAYTTYHAWMQRYGIPIAGRGGANHVGRQPGTIRERVIEMHNKHPNLTAAEISSRINGEYVYVSRIIRGMK